MRKLWPGTGNGRGGSGGLRAANEEGPRSLPGGRRLEHQPVPRREQPHAACSVLGLMRPACGRQRSAGVVGWGILALGGLAGGPREQGPESFDP